MPLVLAPLLLPGLVFFAALVLIALAQTFNAWGGSSTQTGNSGGLLGLMTAVVRIAVNPVSGVIGVAKSGIERLARETVSRWALNHVKPITRWFASLHSLVDGTFARLEALATETARRFEHIASVTLPREIARAVTDIRALARNGVRLGHQALTRVRALEADLSRLRRDLLARVHSLTVAVDVTIPRELGRIRTAEDTLSRDAAKLRDRATAIENGAIKTFEYIRTHPFSAAEGVFAAAVSIALARLGFGFLRCNNWKSLGKKVTCGMGKWLEELLGVIATFALAAFSVLRPEVLANEAVALADVVEPILSAILSE